VRPAVALPGAGLVAISLVVGLTLLRPTAPAAKAAALVSQDSATGSSATWAADMRRAASVLVDAGQSCRTAVPATVNGLSPHCSSYYAAGADLIGSAQLLTGCTPAQAYSVAAQWRSYLSALGSFERSGTQPPRLPWLPQC